MNAASCALTLPSPALNRYAGEDIWHFVQRQLIGEKTGVLSHASFPRGRGEGEGASLLVEYASELLTQDTSGPLKKGSSPFEGHSAGSRPQPN